MHRKMKSMGWRDGSVAKSTAAPVEDLDSVLSANMEAHSL